MLNAGGANHFPSQLHRMLTHSEEDVSGEINRIVSWQQHGRCFMIHDQDEFSRIILPNWFPRLKYPSFQRQLHKHGFRRLHGQGPDKGAYYHEMFQRAEPDMARSIHPTKGGGKRGRKPQATEPNFQNEETQGLGESRHLEASSRDTKLPAGPAGATPRYSLEGGAQGASYLQDSISSASDPNSNPAMYAAAQPGVFPFRTQGNSPGRAAMPQMVGPSAGQLPTMTTNTFAAAAQSGLAQGVPPADLLQSLSFNARASIGSLQASLGQGQDTISGQFPHQAHLQAPMNRPPETGSFRQRPLQQQVEEDQLQQQIQQHSRQLHEQLLIQQQLEAHLQSQIDERRRNEASQGDENKKDGPE